MARLRDWAKYVRSKNAGPFWVTIDIFCESDEAFGVIGRAPALGAEAIGALYGAPSEEVRIFKDQALKVIKISFPRQIVQGSDRDADSHAGQYFVPLLDVLVDADA